MTEQKENDFASLNKLVEMFKEYVEEDKHFIETEDESDFFYRRVKDANKVMNGAVAELEYIKGTIEEVFFALLDYMYDWRNKA